jgi:hypothetical protein
VLRLCVASVAVVLALGVPLSSTTVIPPSFEELVSRAATIFQGDVADRISVWEQAASGPRTIVTIVTFDVRRVLKGSVGAQAELSFLGGTIGNVTLAVGDLPRFNVGDRDVLFVSAEGHAVSPLVGFNHGRVRLAADAATGLDTVWTHDRRPIVGAAGFAPPRFPAPNLSVARAMTYTDFETLVRRELARQQAR